jgi:peptidoglycan/LPS O-acetylase OafA/YrhL
VSLVNITWFLVGTDDPRIIRYVLSPGGVVAMRMAITAGAGLLIVIALSFRGFAQLMSSLPFQWLGTRSYSLYLTHFPIVIGVAHIYKGWSWYGFAVTILLSMAVCELFYRLVEVPSIRAASASGRAVQRAVEAASKDGTIESRAAS